MAESVKDGVRTVEQVNYFVIVLREEEVDQESNHHVQLALELYLVLRLSLHLHSLDYLQFFNSLQIVGALRMRLFNERIGQTVDITGEDGRPSVKGGLTAHLSVLASGQEGVASV